MKILAFSDLHRDLAATEEIIRNADKADVLVGAGDFANKGVGAFDVLSVLQRVNCPLILVAGNHDNPDDLSTMCSDWENVYLLDGTLIRIENVDFFGLGLEIPSRRNATWNITMSEEEAQRALINCPKNSVLITHTPPFGHVDIKTDGRHEGSTAILKAIEDKHPILNLCGHTHNSWGMSSKVGNCHIQNLGPKVNWFNI